MKLIKFFVLGAAFFLAAPVFAAEGFFTPDSVSIEGGSTINSSGNREANTAMGRIGVQWDWDQNWFAKSSPISIDGYWDFSVGEWHSNGTPQDHNITDIGFTPVFRIQPSRAMDFIPYAEIGVGAHYLTGKNITDTRRFSTHYQFGDHVGAGFRFGKDGAYDIGYRLQHLSNAGIDHPNPGINFHQIRLQYHF